jgi:hypothetical protein
MRRVEDKNSYKVLISGNVDETRVEKTSKLQGAIPYSMIQYSEPQQASTHDEGIPIYCNEIALPWQYQSHRPTRLPRSAMRQYSF